jgi:tryptophanyl-tRNA synthetase
MGVWRVSTDKPIKPVMFSGVRPTGRAHLGNLVGAFENWVALQDRYECYICVVDWHALTTGYEDTARLRESARELFLDLLSVGIDPEASTLFIQSQAKQHAELALLLGMVTPLGWLERCPTYKEQLRELEGRDLTNFGFLGYPVLQCADILAHGAEYVPVGQDQLHHLELSREIVRRFNHIYGSALPEPKPLLSRFPVLPGTDGRKMSKSYGNDIAIAAEPAEIRAKVMSMITDPARIRKDDPGHPEVCNVYSLHKAFAAAVHDQIGGECRAGKRGCVACKKELAEAIITYLAPVRQRRAALLADPGRLDDLIERGGAKARAHAETVLAAVRRAMNVWS